MHSNVERTTWDQLPPEVLTLIILFLSIRDKCQIMLVCRLLKDIADSEISWHQECLKKKLNTSVLNKTSLNTISFKMFYRREVLYETNPENYYYVIGSPIRTKNLQRSSNGLVDDNPEDIAYTRGELSNTFPTTRTRIFFNEEDAEDYVKPHTYSENGELFIRTIHQVQFTQAQTVIVHSYNSLTQQSSCEVEPLRRQYFELSLQDKFKTGVITTQKIIITGLPGFEMRTTRNASCLTM